MGKSSTTQVDAHSLGTVLSLTEEPGASRHPSCHDYIQGKIVLQLVPNMLQKHLRTLSRTYSVDLFGHRVFLISGTVQELAGIPAIFKIIFFLQLVHNNYAPTAPVDIQQDVTYHSFGI